MHFYINMLALIFIAAGVILMLIGILATRKQTKGKELITKKAPVE